MAAQAKTLLLLLAACCLPASARVPHASLLVQKPRQGVERLAQASDRGFSASNPLIAPGLSGCLCDEGVRSRCSAKERDQESGLDYFGARYFSASLGRFTGPDKPFVDQFVVDPQSWNLYTYTRNSPLKYVDKNGDYIETAWDVANVGLGVASFVDNGEFRDGARIGILGEPPHRLQKE